VATELAALQYVAMGPEAVIDWVSEPAAVQLQANRLTERNIDLAQRA
jgi:hypothetical protein